MKFGEEIDTHLKREVYEEVGIEIEPGQPFHIWQWQLKRNGGDGNVIEMQIVAVARLCKALTKELNDTGREDDDYLSQMHWVPIGELSTYDWIQNMIPVLEKFLEIVR